ncbi:MAG TPA: outer membrane beta-barrel protein [Allosphingosinicella sp.]
MSKTAFAAALALSSAVVATPALAQDNGTWTGFYAGGHVGYGFQPNDGDETIQFDTNLDGSFGDTVNTSAPANAFSPGFCGGAANTNSPAGECSKDRDRVEFGARVGFDYQMGGGLVVGLVGDYTRSRLNDSVSAFSTTPASYTMTRRLRDVFSLRARAGIAAGDNLFYGTGGIVRGSIRNSFSTTNTANSFTGNGNEKGYGYTVGGGAEHRFGRNLSLGIEYLYRSIKADDHVVRAGPGTAGLTNPFRIVNPNGTDFSRSGDRFTSHGVNLTASFRF